MTIVKWITGLRFGIFQYFLSNWPVDITSETQRLLGRFVILLYDQTSSCTSVNQLRKELFTCGRYIDKIPSTSGALLLYDRRTAYQGGYIWGKSHEKSINPPEATNWGWQKDKNGIYHPLWTLLPIASKACIQLIKCCCKKRMTVLTVLVGASNVH